MRKQWFSAAALVAALAFHHLACASEPRSSCEEILQSPVSDESERRGLVPEDLIGLRDIGPADLPFPDMKLISISPDGTRVAFQLR
ncbi:hypothetical protein, partial [Pseudomonas aeruginosa]